jgi:hypothetical protein
LSDERWGVTVGVLDFALQYPKAIAMKDDRVAVHLLLPRVGKTSFIEIGCTKTHDLIYQSSIRRGVPRDFTSLPGR